MWLVLYMSEEKEKGRTVSMLEGVEEEGMTGAVLVGDKKEG